MVLHPDHQAVASAWHKTQEAKGGGSPVLSRYTASLESSPVLSAPAHEVGMASWGLESGYDHFTMGGWVCTPWGRASEGSFSLMVWHPEIETWVTRSQLGCSPAVWPRQAFTSGSLRRFLCQKATTLVAEAGCRGSGIYWGPAH